MQLSGCAAALPVNHVDKHRTVHEYAWFAIVLLAILLASSAQVAMHGYAAANAPGVEEMKSTLTDVGK